MSAEIIAELRKLADFTDADTYDECWEIKETARGKLLRAAAARLDELERENARLQKERDYAVKWGNQSLDSVKEVMWRYEDALNLIGNSLVCAPTDYAEHNASELLRAGNIARAALAGSGEK
jgi:hypothetical protein